MNVQISVNMSLMWKLNLECRACDIMYECADICEHEFDVEVELGMSGLRVNYTMSNASSVIVWKVIVVIT